MHSAQVSLPQLSPENKEMPSREGSSRSGFLTHPAQLTSSPPLLLCQASMPDAFREAAPLSVIPAALVMHRM